MSDDLDDGELDDSDDEVEVMIVPKDDVLDEFGISQEAFEEALGKAIDEYHALIEGLGDEEDAPTAEDMAVRIGDRTYRLGDLAEVQIADEDDFDESE